MSISKIKTLVFDVCQDNPELNRARFKALSSQVPFMYAIVLINMYALTCTHLFLAPIYLTVILPVILTLIAISRSIGFIKADPQKMSDEQIVNRLQAINYAAFAIGFLGILWALILFQFGNAYTQSHIAFFICLTAVCAITCLMHLYQSALIITAMIILPAIIYFMFHEQIVFNAIAVNIFMVAGAMLLIMLRYSKDFTNLIENQQKLEQQSQTLVSLNKENIKLANIDSLTGLPNRRCFFSKIEEMLKQRQLNKAPFVIGVLDLDGFKQINDLFGHPAGDKLLADTSQRLSDLLNEGIFLARLGGDEFGIIIEGPGQEKQVLDIGNQICAALKTPYNLREGTAQISGTIGFANFPQAGQTAKTLFERADYALCYSKQNAKGTVTMFSSEHETIIREVSFIAHLLRESNLDQELSMVYQPVINAQTQEVIGFEALARWKSSVLGNVSPNVFIRSAEQNGMISQLTHILLEKTLKTANQWPKDVQVSFNLSIFDLCSHESTLKLMSIINQSDLSPKRITFEITETAIMQDYDRALEGLHLLRNLGCKIALDDFGTGFSSLSYLHRLPIDRVKLDRSFIEDIEQSHATQNIIHAMAQLCANLELECIVEGVENQQQLDILNDMDLHFIQGFYYSKPLSQEAALDYLEGASQSLLAQIA